MPALAFSLSLFLCFFFTRLHSLSFCLSLSFSLTFLFKFCLALTCTHAGTVIVALASDLEKEAHYSFQFQVVNGPIAQAARNITFHPADLATVPLSTPILAIDELEFETKAVAQSSVSSTL